MPTLFLTARHTSDSQGLWRAAVRQGWTVHRLQGWRIPDELKSVAEPVLYAEALVAPVLAEQLGLELLEAADDWLTRVPDQYRKRWVQLSTLGEARRLDQPTFVKPPNDKSFPADVYRGADLPVDFADDKPVLLSEVVEWEKEFRCFVLDGRVRTCSVYLRNGEVQEQNDFFSTAEEEAELRAFVEPLLADERVVLPRAAVLDAGVIQGRGWAVVEQNAAWGAGIYGCDPDEVLEVLRYAVAPQCGE